MRLFHFVIILLFDGALRDEGMPSFIGHGGLLYYMALSLQVHKYSSEQFVSDNDEDTGCLCCESVPGVDVVLRHPANNKCYYVNKTNFKRNCAKQFCEERNLHLVTLETKSEEDWIRTKLLSEPGISRFQYWIGVEYLCGNWIWPTGYHALSQPGNVDARLINQIQRPSYVYVDLDDGWEGVEEDAVNQHPVICETYTGTHGTLDSSIQRVICKGQPPRRVDKLDEFDGISSLPSCVSQCVRNKQCFAVLFASESGRCITLNTNSLTGTPLSTEAGYLFYPVRKEPCL